MEQERDVAVAALRGAIQSAFPVNVFHDAVTPVDGEPWAEEIDDDLDLRDNLCGRAWDEVPVEVIDRQADGLPLLANEAFRVFLPAWLARSLDNLDGESKVREFTVYEFLPFEGRTPNETAVNAWLDADNLAKHDLLSLKQRQVVEEFLVLVSRYERDTSIRADAQTALESWISHSMNRP
jgi:hypothetical protein